MAGQAAVKRVDQDGRLDRILGLVNAMLAKKGKPAAGAGQDLREAGLGSLDTVNLMLAVEGEFDLFLPQDEVRPENFHSATTIAALIDRLA